MKSHSLIALLLSRKVDIRGGLQKVLHICAQCRGLDMLVRGMHEHNNGRTCVVGH